MNILISDLHLGYSLGYAQAIGLAYSLTYSLTVAIKVKLYLRRSNIKPRSHRLDIVSSETADSPRRSSATCRMEKRQRKNQESGSRLLTIDFVRTRRDRLENFAV